MSFWKALRDLLGPTPVARKQEETELLLEAAFLRGPERYRFETGKELPLIPLSVTDRQWDDPFGDFILVRPSTIWEPCGFLRNKGLYVFTGLWTGSLPRYTQTFFGMTLSHRGSRTQFRVENLGYRDRAFFLKHSLPLPELPADWPHPF